MQCQPINTADATPVALIEAQILMGFEDCKSISEIAADIAALLDAQKVKEDA